MRVKTALLLILAVAPAWAVMDQWLSRQSIKTGIVTLIREHQRYQPGSAIVDIRVRAKKDYTWVTAIYADGTRTSEVWLREVSQ